MEKLNGEQRKWIFGRTFNIVSDFIGTATFIKGVGKDGYWLTAFHVIDSNLPPKINGHIVEIYRRGWDGHKITPAKSKIEVPKQLSNYDWEADRSQTVDWAIISTPGFRPHVPDSVFCLDVAINDECVYVNKNRHKSIGRVVIEEVSKNIIRSSTKPQYGNSGSALFNKSLEIIGVVTHLREELDGRSNRFTTEYVKINKEIMDAFRNIE